MIPALQILMYALCVFLFLLVLHGATQWIRNYLAWRRYAKLDGTNTRISG